MAKAGDLTRALLDQVLRRRQKGETFTTIGLDLGFSGSGLSVAVAKHKGIPRKHGVGRLTDEARDQMLTLRARSATVSAIAIASGFSAGTVEQVLRQARAEGDDRASKDASVRAATLLRDAVLEDDDDVPEFVAPDPKVVASLMMRGFSRWEAIAQSIADKKARARREQAVAAARPVGRVSRQPFKLGQSLSHETHHERTFPQCPGYICPTNFGGNQ